jgi:integrase
MATLVKRRRADGRLGYRVQDRTTGYPSLSETFDTLADAREYRRKIEAERQRGLAGIGQGRHLLREAVHTFTETDAFRHRKSARDTRRHLEWWADRLGQLPLGKITAELIADHLHKLEADGCSGSTVNRYRSALSRVFRYAMQTRHWVGHNPCRMVERRKEGRRRERVLRPKEWKSLLEASQELASQAAPASPMHQLGNFLRVLYGTGARRSEVLGMRWDHVDLPGERLRFPDTKSGEGRTVPLVGDALAAIAEQGAFRREGCPWVFPGTSDQKPARFDTSFRAARTHAKLAEPDARGEMLVMHSLRHSACTEAGKGGATAFEIAALTGHKTLAMVQRYTKTDETNAGEALRKRAQT